MEATGKINTIEGNKLIAQFMGKDVLHDTHVYHEKVDRLKVTRMKYDTSWSWLMPVVEKIERETDYGLVSGSDYAYWNKYGENPLDEEFSGARKEAIYEAVVEFITWHNSKHGSTGETEI